MSNTPPEFSPDLHAAGDTLQPFDVREHEGLNPMIKLALLAAGLLIAAFIVMKLYTPGVRDRSETPPAARPVVTRPPVATTTATRGSDWVVQVASTRSQADAKNVWDGLLRKYPNLVSGNYADVKRVDLGDKGIYYRTRIAGLADKAAAQSLCNSFKAVDQACFVAKR